MIAGLAELTAVLCTAVSSLLVDPHPRLQDRVLTDEQRHFMDIAQYWRIVASLPPGSWELRVRLAIAAVS